MLLADLPHFEIDEVVEPDGLPRLVGRFTSLVGVREGRSWLYSPENAVIGDLENLVTARKAAVFVAPYWTREGPAQTGASLPWIDGYWQAYHVDMILRGPSTWEKTTFVPIDAQYFELNGGRGWQPLGNDLPSGAIPREVVRGGWDHEHCQLCQGKIGVEGASEGYRDTSDRWLCESCYERYALRPDLSFLVGG